LALGAEQVRLLYANRLPPLINSAVLAGIFASVQWEALRHELVLSWLVLVWLVTLAHAVLNVTYKRLKPEVAINRLWLNRSRLCAFSGGAAWGLGGVMLFPSQDLAHQGFLAFMLAGVTIDAVITYSADRPSVIGFLLLALVPFVVSTLIEGNHVSYEIGLAVLLFFGFALGNAFKLYRGLQENIALRVRAESNEQQLRQKRLDLRQINRKLTSSVHKLHRNLRENEILRLRAEFGEELLLKREADLSLLNERLTVLIEAIPDAIFLKNGKGHLLVANEVAKQLFDLHGLDWQGKTDKELALVSPKISPLQGDCLENDEKAWEAGSLILFQKSLVGEDGRICELEVRKVPTFSADGARKGLVIIGRDITERRRADEALRESEGRFRNLLQNVATVAVQGYAMDGTVQYWNHASERFYGYQAEEAIGRNLKDLIISPEMRDQVGHNMQLMAETGQPIAASELSLVRKDGSRVIVFSSQAVVQAPGRAPEMFCIDIDLTERRKAEEEIHNLAYYDHLTGLSNRRMLLDRLKLALAVSARRNQHGAILFIDLDNFKTLNDTRGHDMGDLLLIEVAKRLSGCVRREDTVSRLGGDEFVVMLEDLSQDSVVAAKQAEQVGEKILGALNQPYILRGFEHSSTPSIGVSLFLGAAETAEEILKYADTAMYQAKKFGRNTLRFFNPAMQASLEVRVELESALRQALPRQQFRLFYQVQVDERRQVIGAEVLLRWQHPVRGLISPAEFIPVAEENGMIVPIGLWVLQAACVQLKIWEDSPHVSALQLAVNVSARQFRQADFVEQVSEILYKTEVNPAKLKLELTESLVLENVADTIEKMQALKALGLSFSMDDFGTGHSSLAQLKKLPLDQVKIDQSFVHDIATDPNDAAIVQAIIAMTEALGFSVIAEGVETETQLAFLKRHGCLQFQGYLFGEPMPLIAFERQLINRHEALFAD
jgi:diguanylate cyclase (GGDEF)-like protein/PAS domain S-box-containing protein